MQKQRKKATFEPIRAYWFCALLYSCCLFIATQEIYSESVLAKQEDSIFSLFNFKDTKEKEPTQAAESPSSSYDIADQISGLIYQGDFEAAGSLIKDVKKDVTDESEGSQVVQFEKVIQGYQEIQEQLQSARESSYQKKLQKLEKLQSKENTGDVNDANDANDLLSVLSTIAEAVEVANVEQKAQLLSKSFVVDTLKEAKAKADGYENEGKWLDAYSEYYAWMRAIYEDNEGYSDYGDKLLDKANVEASFRDSPCETTRDRYRGVKRSMFERAVEALNFNYVSIEIDYMQMMTKGIERCKLLADVARLSSVDDVNDIVENGCLPSDPQKLTAWMVAMDSLLDEVNTLSTGMSKDKFLDFFDKVLSLNKSTAEFPETILIAQFSEASLSALDPYTVMIWPKQKEDFEKLMTNEFTGIGIEISKQKGWLTVASLLPDTPAYRSGLDAGDIIEAVEGESTKNMSLTCAVRRITGPAGTEVELTIRSPGDDKTREIMITRDKIVVPTTRGWKRTTEGKWLYMLDQTNKIGYVRLTSFSEKTSDDLERILDELEAEGLQGLILDLRSNTGGLLTSAIDITDKFIDKGLIVSTRPRYGMWTYAEAQKKGTHPDYPLVVLINSVSASASEIVAGSLQDQIHKRAILVGERTHGKGSVQGITSYPEGGSQLKYTMAYYHLPSGKKVESQGDAKKDDRKDWGVGPDVEVKLTIEELRKMLKLQRDNDVLVRADHKEDDNGKTKHTLEETLSADPQLAIGLLVVKTQRIQENSLVQN
ncbi:MAG: S41 family peptidase [Planctomycetota bacterium]